MQSSPGVGPSAAFSKIGVVTPSVTPLFETDTYDQLFL
jgi:hypothetical protein